jgi:hypothetical protein
LPEADILWPNRRTQLDVCNAERKGKAMQQEGLISVPYLSMCLLNSSVASYGISKSGEENNKQALTHNQGPTAKQDSL